MSKNYLSRKEGSGSKDEKPFLNQKVQTLDYSVKTISNLSGSVERQWRYQAAVAGAGFATTPAKYTNGASHVCPPLAQSGSQQLWRDSCPRIGWLGTPALWHLQIRVIKTLI